MRRVSFGLVLAVALAGISVFSVGSSGAAAPGCPNEAFRTGLSAQLPECRAYEMVSPLEKGNLSVTRQDGGDFAGGASLNSTTVLSRGEGGISYVAGGTFAGTEASTGVGQPYLSTRGPDGWGTTGIAPPRNPPTSFYFIPVSNLAISADGAKAVAQTPATLMPAAPRCETYVCPLQLYLRDNVTHTYKVISRAPVSGPAGEAVYEASTPDLSRILFEESAVLVPGAPENIANLYEWIDNGTEAGELKLIGYEPSSTTAFPGGAAPGTGASGAPDSINENRRAISTDGRRVVFNAEGQVYVREDGTTTIPVSKSQRSTPDPEGTQLAVFRTAEAAHGSTVFFTSGEELTDDSHATPTEPDLYRFEVTTRTLTDITANAAAADVQGVIGASEDAKSVYFAADAQLIPGKGTAGEPNVYLWRDNGTPNGTLTYITSVPTPAESQYEEINWWFPGSRAVGQQVSDNGRFMVLASRRPLTEGFANEGFVEVYRYDAETGDLACASCNPYTTSATASSIKQNPTRVDTPTSITDEGLVAFQSGEALTPADTNGQEDVYDWDGGRPQLISGGKSPVPSTYLGMDTSGRDLYFATGSQLLPGDTDELIDLYDARIGGGLPEPTPKPACSGGECRGTGSSPAVSGSIGSGLDGAGNLRPKAASCTAPRKAAKKDRRRAKRAKNAKRARKLRKRAQNLERTAKRCTTKNGRAGK